MASQSTFDIPLDSLPPSYRTTERNTDFDPIRRAETGTPEPQDTSVQEPARHEFSQLPPVDGGKDAWLFLAACFVVEALVWGTFSIIYHAPLLGNISQKGQMLTVTLYTRLPLLLRRLPRLLQHPPALFFLQQPRRYRHLRHGYHVHRHSLNHVLFPAFSAVRAMGSHCWVASHVFRPRHVILLHNRHALDRHPGNSLRHRGFDRLLSLHSLPG